MSLAKAGAEEDNSQLRVNSSWRGQAEDRRNARSTRNKKGGGLNSPPSPLRPCMNLNTIHDKQPPISSLLRWSLMLCFIQTTTKNYEAGVARMCDKKSHQGELQGCV